MKKRIWNLSLHVFLAGSFLSAGAVAAGPNRDSPVIANLKFEPDSAPKGGGLLVRIQVYDRQGPDDVDPVLHLLREGRELISIPLYDDATHGDRMPGDGFYSGPMSVPSTADSGVHWFLIYLYDKEGNRSNLLVNEFRVTDQRTIL